MTISLTYELFIGSTYDGGALNFDDNFDDNGYNGELLANISCKIFDDYIKSITKIAKVELSDYWTLLSKYGINFKSCKFETPQYYNYRNDMLVIKTELTDKLFKLLPSLKSAIEHYHNEIKQKSYDGYISLEPADYQDTVSELKDGKGTAIYGVLHAIGQLDDQNGQKTLDNAIELIRDKAQSTHNTLFQQKLPT